MKILKKSCILPFLWLLLSCAPAGDDRSSSEKDQNADAAAEIAVHQKFSVVFYNTENLYDTIDSPGIDDADFTPDTRIPWTSARFKKKLERMADVLGSIASPRMPDIIGLAEVENRAVLESLILTGKIKGAGYDIIHYDSPDERGSDVALLYRRDSFKITGSEAIKVKFRNSDDKTRDILSVKGKMSGGQTLHIMVNHWPSRREGTKESEYKRVDAAAILRQKVDKILREDPAADIVIMGDFNDEPADRSIRETLQALPPVKPYAPGSLYNLLYPEFSRGEGTTYYRSWDMFDQVIVTGNLLDRTKGFYCTPGSASVYRAARLIHRDRNGAARPNRTMGDKYYGGYSDHLPVILVLEK